MEQYTLRQYMEKNPDAKLRDIVADMLYDEIVSLRIAPGAKLNVNQLASSLGISRTPVAEAIARLTDIGFIMPSVRCALYCESRVPRTAQTVGLPRPSKAFSIWFLSMTLPSCVYTSITSKRG